MKLKLALATLILSMSSATMAGSADVQKAIEAARASQKEAKALGFEWRDMGKMIKKAEKLAKKGKNKKAIAIASLVAKEIVPIRKQAALAKTAGPRF